MSKIYLMHEYYTPSHYNSLVELARQNGDRVVFMEFDLRKEFRNSAKHPRKWYRFVRNVLLYLYLRFSKNKTVLIAIAPFNPLLPRMMKFLKNHRVYMHGSYSCWDGSRVVHEADNTVKEKWKWFMNNMVIHFFAVSNKTKGELIKNDLVKEQNISVVNHSYIEEIRTDDLLPKSNNFISVGSLHDRKGVRQLLEFFAIHPEATITFVGKGPLEGLVNEYSAKCSNIKCIGFIKGLQNIIPIYKQHSFLILNSMRTDSWEELFGMVLFESMACGCVPIANDHPGPLEIITDGVNGFISKEGEIDKNILKAITLTASEYEEMRKRALIVGQGFRAVNIADRWMAIYEKK